MMKALLLVSLVVSACFSGCRAIYGGRSTTSEENPFAAVICSTTGDRIDRAAPNENATDADSLLDVAFGVPGGDDEDCHAVCSGSLVSPGVVLSAAHCFSSLAEFFIDMRPEARESFLQNLTSTITVNFSPSLSGGKLKASDGYGVERIVIEEGFDLGEGSAESNLALLFLESCVEDRSPIKMLKNVEVEVEDSLTSSSALDLMSEGMDLTVVGFGDSHPACVSQEEGLDHSISEEMQEMEYELTKVNQVNQQVTQEMLERCEASPNPLCGKVGELKEVEPTCNGTLMLCLKSENNGATCTGDGGAPVFAYTKEDAADGSQRVQIGVVGTGMVEVEGGSIAKNDLIYTDYAFASLLTGHTEWLESNLANDTCLNLSSSDSDSDRSAAVSDLFLSTDELEI